MIDGCEWNPEENRPTRTDEESHAQAEVILGNGIWRVCSSCSRLPCFTKMHYRVVLIIREVNE